MAKYAIIPHMGLGDQIVLKALVRKVAEVADEVVVFGKVRYEKSLRDIYHDLPNVYLALVEDAHVVSPAFGADGRAWKQLEDKGYQLLPLGYHTASKAWLGLDPVWSRALYKSMGLTPSIMYDGFSVHIDAAANAKLLDVVTHTYGRDYVLVHDDPSRDMRIEDSWLPPRLPRVHVDDPGVRSDNVSDYCALIENARETHMIDSCFALLADFLCEPHQGPKRFVHVTPGRPDTPPDLYRGTEVVRHGASSLTTPTGQKLSI